MKTEGLPESILNNLKGIENQEFTGKEGFLDAVKLAVGEDLAIKYEDLFLKHVSKVE